MGTGDRIQYLTEIHFRFCNSGSPDVDADELRRDDLVDVADGVEHALPAVDRLVPVSELEGLVDPRGSAAGHGGAVEPAVARDEVDLHGGVPTAVQDLARADRPHRLRPSRGSRRRGERRADGHDGAAGAAAARGGRGQEGLGGEEEVVGHPGC